MKPTLSVIVTNYNHGQYLRNAIATLLSQSRMPDEVIIIDDASTDNSREIIAEFEDQNTRVKAVYNEKNTGVILNANRGLQMSTGTYVFFAAADDFILPSFFEKLMVMAERHPGVGVLSCVPAFLRDDQMVTAALPFGDSERFLDGDALVRTQRAAFFQLAGHAAILHRQSAIDAGALLPQLRWHSDWFMNNTVAFRRGLAYTPEALSVMRVISSSYSSSSMHKWENQKPVLSELSRLLREDRYSDVRQAYARSGMLMTFDPFFARLAFQNIDAFSLLRPVLLKRILANFLWRTRMNMLIPRSIRKFRRARARARLERLDAS